MSEAPLAVERGVPLGAQKLSGERQEYSDHFRYDFYCFWLPFSSPPGLPDWPRAAKNEPEPAPKRANVASKTELEKKKKKKVSSGTVPGL